MCDGYHQDCLDGADEDICPTTPAPSFAGCAADEFLCAEGSVYRNDPALQPFLGHLGRSIDCIRRGAVCNMHSDCLQGSDEVPALCATTATAATATAAPQAATRGKAPPTVATMQTAADTRAHASTHPGTQTAQPTAAATTPPAATKMEVARAAVDTLVKEMAALKTTLQKNSCDENRIPSTAECKEASDALAATTAKHSVALTTFEDLDNQTTGGSGASGTVGIFVPVLLVALAVAAVLIAVVVKRKQQAGTEITGSKDSKEMSIEGVLPVCDGDASTSVDGPYSPSQQMDSADVRGGMTNATYGMVAGASPPIYEVPNTDDEDDGARDSMANPTYAVATGVKHYAVPNTDDEDDGSGRSNAFGLVESDAMQG